MSASTNNSSLASSRNLRSNSLKTSTLNPQVTIQQIIGPSSVELFLANLRLLDLDLRHDWPKITALTFSTSARQENQKKRIQCVEWALYQLFALWDPEETRNKLQPYYPPLEPLQSLNLRAALFRCLDHAKNTGVLGRDTVLRKTMLDECKGDRLEEVLAVFSNTVLKKVLQSGGSDHLEAISRQLAFENFSYHGERTVLSALILAHKASLSNHLRAKNESRAKFQDFSNLLDLNDRRIVRRQEQLKELVSERGVQDQISSKEACILQDQAQRNWSGNDKWLETILYGDSRFGREGLLAAPFERVWKHVEDNTIGDVEGKYGAGLLEQLDARVKDQENRLARWQDFGRTLCQGSSASTSNRGEPEVNMTKIDLGFKHHQDLQVGRSYGKSAGNKSAALLDDYTRLIDNMKDEIAAVCTPQIQNIQAPRQSFRHEELLPTIISPLVSSEPSGNNEEWSSASDTDELSPDFNAAKTTFQTPPFEVLEEPEVKPYAKVNQTKSEIAPRASIPQKDAATESSRRSEPVYKERSLSPEPLTLTPPPIDPPKVIESESNLADQILNSISTASTPPKKQRHTLSLAERTRLSMAGTSQSQFADMNNDRDNVADLPRLSLRPKPASRVSLSASSEDDKHAALIERTRKSMAGFEAAQKKAQIERRRSVKDAKKKHRESTYFPRLEEEEVATPSVIDKKELMEGDPDYDSVFKSRPKIKTSPAVSPTREWDEDDIIVE